MKYEPKNFSDLFATPMGADLWEYLQRPSVVLALEVATKLHRPAIEAIGDDLIGEFGEVVRSKRIKQLVGHMVRQLLESRGYELEAQRVVARCDGLFSTGSRYRRAGTPSPRPLKLEKAEQEPAQPVPRPKDKKPVDKEPVTTEEGGDGSDWAAWGGPEPGADVA